MGLWIIDFNLSLDKFKRSLLVERGSYDHMKSMCVRENLFVKTVRQILKNETFVFNGKVFPLDVDYLIILHHWYFGLTKEYYRSTDKKVVLPDIKGQLVEIREIGTMLDKFMKSYQDLMDKKTNAP